MVNNYTFSAIPRDSVGLDFCLCEACVGGIRQPTFSVGVGGGPGDFDLESAMREQPFEHIETFRGYRSFREMSHIGAEDVAVNFLIRQLRDEAKDVWEAVYSNRFDSRNLVYRIFHFERNDFEYPDFEF